MAQIISIETKDGHTAMTVQAETDPSRYVPPPEGWRRTAGAMDGHDRCIIEDLLVRGLDSGDACIVFCLPHGVQRQELSHEQDAAGIVDRCRNLGITVAPGEIIDADRLRTFRGWRLSR